MTALRLLLSLALLTFGRAQGPVQPAQLSAYCVLIHPSSSSNASVTVNQDVLIGFYELAPSSFGIAFQNVDVWCRYPNGTSTWLMGWENESCLSPIGAGYKNLTVDQPGEYVVSWNMSYAEPRNSSVNAVNLTSCDPADYFMSTFTASFNATAAKASQSTSSGGVAEVTETRTFSLPIETGVPNSANGRVVQATGILGCAGLVLALFLLAY